MSGTKGRRGSALVMGALLAVVVAALTVSLLGSTIAHQRGVEGNLAIVRAREAAESALALRVLELQAGDATTVNRTYSFPHGARAAVVLYSYSPSALGLEIDGRAGQARTQLFALLRGGEQALAPRSISRGNLFLANHVSFSNNNVAFIPFDSRLGLPSSSNTSGRAKVFANKTVTMTNQTVFNGTVVAGQSISLENNSVIADTARSPSVVTKNHSTVGVVNNAPPPTIALPSYDALIDGKLAAAKAIATERGNVTIPNKGELRVGPNQVVRFGNVDTGNQGTLRIDGPATVIFNNLVVNNNSDIRISGDVELIFEGSAGLSLRNQAVFVMPDRGDGYTDARVTIYSKGNQVWENNGNAGGVPAKPSNFQVYMYSNNLLFEFRNQSYFYGSILNPGGRLELKNNTRFYGFAMADRITLQNQSRLYYDVALDAELLEDGGSGGGTTAPDPAAWRVEKVADGEL